jgi:ribosomal protein L37E
MTHHDVRCERCGRTGYVLLSLIQKAMLCAMCHHGGPQKVTPIRGPRG